MKKHILVSLTADFFTARIGENIGIRYIKSFLHSSGHELEILENQFLKLSNEDLAMKLADYDVIGFSVNYCGQLKILKDILNYISDTNKIIYLGGHFATVCYEEILLSYPKVQFIMVSDGEMATLELIQNNYNYENIHNVAYKKGEDIILAPIKLIAELDKLPYPYRDDNSYYLGDNHFSMITSRGCYHRCSYCSVGAYTHKYYNNVVRFRSAKNIFNEIKFLKENYDIQYITFQDDLFIGTDEKTKKRAVELAYLILESNLKIFFSIQCSVKSVNYEIFNLLYQAGLRNVMIGIENFSDHALECFNKRQSTNDVANAITILNRIGIPISYGFIMYYPEMKHSEILENIETLYRLKIINIRSITSCLQIYKGTEYSSRVFNSIYIDYNYEIKYSFQDPSLNTYIKNCKLFAKKYGSIEKKLHHLEFISHTNSKVDKEQVEKCFDEYKQCLYSFSKDLYFEIFYNKPNLSFNSIKMRLNKLEECIGKIKL